MKLNTHTAPINNAVVEVELGDQAAVTRTKSGNYRLIITEAKTTKQVSVKLKPKTLLCLAELLCTVIEKEQLCTAPNAA